MLEQTITIWITAIYNHKGLSSKPHMSEAGAWVQLAHLFAVTEEERQKAEEFIATADFVALRSFLNRLLEKYNTIVAYNIEKQELNVSVPEPTDAGVSESENDFGVTVTVDVEAACPGEAPQSCIEYLGISQEVARTLTFHVSSLESGGKWEMSAAGTLLPPRIKPQ